MAEMSGYKILVVSKKSTLELAEEHGNSHILDLVEKKDSTVAKLEKADQEHRETLETLKNEFKHQMLKGSYISQVVFKDRSDEIKGVENYDYVFSVGGDGTFLWVSKMVPEGIPILGINSDPSTSVGFFTCCDKTSIPRLVCDFAASQFGPQMPSVDVCRLQVSVNGEVVSKRVLNDILFAAEHPAAMTSYILTAPMRNGFKDVITEEQRSSGIWLSTAAGSTGANLSAGGWILPLNDNRGQIVVREPMKNFVWGTEHRFTHGLFSEMDKIKLKNKTRRAILAIDGTTGSIPITTGDEISISISPERLKILGKSAGQNRY